LLTLFSPKVKRILHDAFDSMTWTSLLFIQTISTRKDAFFLCSEVFCIK